MATNNEMKKVLFDKAIHDRSTAKAYCVMIDCEYIWFPTSMCKPNWHAHWMECPTWLVGKMELERYMVDI